MTKNSLFLYILLLATLCNNMFSFDDDCVSTCITELFTEIFTEELERIIRVHYKEISDLEQVLKSSSLRTQIEAGITAGACGIGCGASFGGAAYSVYANDRPIGEIYQEAETRLRRTERRLKAIENIRNELGRTFPDRSNVEEDLNILRDEINKLRDECNKTTPSHS